MTTHPSFYFRVALCVWLVLSASAGSGNAATILSSTNWANDLTPIADKDWNTQRAAHLLERAGFGGTPEEIKKLASMTPAQAVDYLVDYEQIDEAALPAFEPSGIYPHGSKLAPLQVVGRQVLTTGMAYGIPAVQEGELPLQPVINEFYTLLISEYAEMRRAGQWWANRMLLTPRPLQEKLTLFWHDHFATSQEKVLNYELMLGQIQTLRANANGNFRTLLIRVAQDPAMLVWLDNRDNKKGHANENFAREVMELFCMGEGQGYTEADIRELARAFTGWTLHPVATVKDHGEFMAEPEAHDDGIKSFLGARGNFDGTEAIKIILQQPATPRFLVRKLYRYFVREEISPAMADQLAARLVQSDYELKPLLKTIFLSRDFYSAPSMGTQIKAPVSFLISTYRKLGLKEIPGVPEFTETAGALGQVLFYPPNVAGWPGGRTWINPATLFTRGNFAHTLLFPETAPNVALDKVVAEGYRRIPQTFRQYKIKPRIWSDASQRMEPVSLNEYDKFLATLEAGDIKPVTQTAKIDVGDPGMSMSMYGGGSKSKMSQIASTEWFNLAVGVYTGFVEAYNRVKPVPRTTATVDFVGMLREAKVKTSARAVDYFCGRFLSVELSAERHDAIFNFLKTELNSERLNYQDAKLAAALRQTVHLILSAPEYQLD